MNSEETRTLHKKMALGDVKQLGGFLEGLQKTEKVLLNRLVELTLFDSMDFEFFKPV